MNADPISSVGANASTGSFGGSRGLAVAPSQATPLPGGETPISQKGIGQGGSGSIEASLKNEKVEKSLNPEALKEALGDMNERMKASNINLEFQFEKTGAVKSVKLIDTNTQQTILQFPSEQVLAIREQIDQWMSKNQPDSGYQGPLPGTLFSKTV